MNKGFTLTELLISIALALVLIAGVNQVFKATGDAIGAGMSVSKQNRDAQSSYGVLRADLESTVSDPPFFAITNQRTQAWRDRQEEDEGAALTPYRTDRIIMFGRGSYPRQTGSGGDLVANYGEHEAYIWLGHLSRNGQAPGNGTSATNPANFYASDWALGRVVIGMNPWPDGGVQDGSSPPVSQEHFAHDPAHTTTPNLTPFMADARSTDGAWTMPQHRYDSANITIGDYRWLVEHTALTMPNWWTVLVNFRFQDATDISRPLNAETIARTSPALLENVSGFIVEFTGDWVTQDATGAITALDPDNVLDFAMVGNVKHVRWYGMERDLDGDGTADVIPLGTFAGAVAPFERMNTADAYVCVWGGDFQDSRPRQVRMIITQSDPSRQAAGDAQIDLMSPIQ